MAAIPPLVTQAELLTRIFGYWPSFHDAEVLELSLSRGSEGIEVRGDLGPVLTAKIYVFEMTSEVGPRGYFVLKNHTVVTLQFRDVDRLEMEGFNYQNAIYGLSIEQAPDEDNTPPRLAITFDPANGLGATFACTGVHVLRAQACGPRE